MKGLVLELQPAPNSAADMKLLLWILGPGEIKLQGVDIKDYDNPTAHIPKETNENTFRLKKIG